MHMCVKIKQKASAQAFLKSLQLNAQTGCP